MPPTLRRLRRLPTRSAGAVGRGVNVVVRATAGAFAALAVLALVGRLSAADLLRSGRTVAAAGSSAVAAATASAPSAKDLLAQTTTALQAVQTMQATARALAAAASGSLGPDPNHVGQSLPTVADGLGLGGLQAATGSNALWLGAQNPTQATSGGATVVTIVQTTQQALLHWTTFNVGRKTTVAFDQSAGGSNVGEWIAFNEVLDPSGVPSQILGSVTAAGQVYLINPNGIIFGGASQVNVHALVASSLPLNENLLGLGLLNNPDDQFLLSSLSIAAGPNGTPAFNPAPSPLPGGANGDVTVRPGAVIASPTTADHVGGRIVLAAPNVTNGGTLFRTGRPGHPCGRQPGWLRRPLEHRCEPAGAGRVHWPGHGPGDKCLGRPHPGAPRRRGPRRPERQPARLRR